MISTLAHISKSSSPFTNRFVTVPSAPITIDITVTFMFHSFSVLLQGLRTYLYLKKKMYLMICRDDNDK